VVAAGAPALPKVAASSFVIADADTGRVLAAKDPHGRYLPASTLKTLTAATLIPKLDPDATVKPTAFTTKVVPTTIGLDTKKTYKVQDLFRIMLMISANDAAKAIAQAAGGYQKAIAMLNAEARRLGAKDTLAGSPNGLDDDLGLSVRTQHSSAYDLALIFRQGLRLPDFINYIGTLRCKFPYWGIQTTHDKMLVGPYKYPGMIGGKTGFTTAAMQNFVGAARRNGHTIIIAEMHSTNQFWADATKLLDWGFSADGKVDPVGTLVNPAPAAAPAPGGASASANPAPAPASAASPRAVDASRASSDSTLPMPVVIVGGLAVLAAGLLAGFLIVAARRAH
jgi:D-alanyl-D-alanine carboxypeptidase (penicillin-binding protein 5/6)